MTERHPAETCLALLRAAGASLATAESLTAGLVASRLASVAGASDVLRGGVVAYATDVKTSVLGVDAALVEAHGVVSAACAEAMAVRARALFRATWGVSTTGVAGPDRQEGKAVGTVFVGLAGPDVLRVQALYLDGLRNEIRQAAARQALELMAEALQPPG